RNNLALALTSGEDGRFGARCDPVALLAKHGVKTDGEVLNFLLGVFFQDDVPQNARDTLQNYQTTSRNLKYPAYCSTADVSNQRVRAVTHLALTPPEFQLN